MVSSDTPPPNPKLGNYELLMMLAQGGMATVYAARQSGAAGFERLVVVKRVHEHLLEDVDFYHMFRDEASMASLVRHPNVVSVTDVVEAEGELFLVMDYVDGAALSSILKAGRKKEERPPPRVAVRIILDTLSGLHAAHEAVGMRGERLELVHRDVSPHNIIVGGDGISRLIDFGVAKAAHRSTHTRSGALKGKYPYMSPEQAKGLRIDRRADVFAAAACLHEALVGKRLFQGENDLDTLRRVMEAPIPDPSSIAGDIPRELDLVLQQALARDPNERYQTALDFHDALQTALAPAAPRDVRAYLEYQCADRLAERRGALQAMMEGKVAPLSLKQTRSGDDPSNSLRVRPVTPPAVPSARPSDSKSGSKGTQITHDAPIVPISGSRGRVVAMTGGLAVLIVGGLFIARAAMTPEPHRIDSQGGAGGGAPSTTAPGNAPLADDKGVELTVVADAPIESVRAHGALSAGINGTSAKLRVQRWSGTLTIDAVLVSGKLAHGNALEGTVGEVRLATEAAEAGPAARPPVRAPTQPAQQQQPQGGGTELHPNPYGP